jgi:hypothetical protein
MHHKTFVRAVGLGGAMVLAGQGLFAQEVAVYRVNATPGPWKDATRTFGYAVAWTGKLKADSKVQAGFRVAFSESRDSTLGGVPCIACLSVASPPRHIRLRTTEIVFLFLPYATRATRVEFGAGTALYNFSGYLKNQGSASLITTTLSRRLIGRLPVWGTVGFALHYSPNANFWPQDGPSARTPQESFRFGLLLRR